MINNSRRARLRVVDSCITSTYFDLNPPLMISDD